MAKKPAMTFDHLTLVEPSASTQSSERTNTQTDTQESPHAGDQASRVVGEYLKEASAHRMVYLSPEAAKAIDRYALEASTHKRKVKPHDIMLEAVQDWLDKHGMQVKARAPTRKG